MVYYIGYYNCDEIRNEDRIVAPAAENKMQYVISALAETSRESFEVISPAETRLYRYIKGKKQRIREHVVLKTFSTFSSKNKLLRGLGHVFTRMSFLLYLLLNVESKDHLIVYHSLIYMNTIKMIRELKKCKLTFEVEELYSDVTEDEKLRKKEIDYLQIADNYLFITELLRSEVNMEKKALISHGTYRPIQDFGVRFNDGKIHIVYAGTFRKAKGGAYTAIAAAEYLDDNYVLEVLGKGSEKETAAVTEFIEEVSGKTTCKINYAGFKTGDEFNKYIQACHVGLSTQISGAKFNATSFPSKVLMYMSNGIKVVSVRIPAVESSQIGESIYYYDSQDPKEIANVIRSVSFDDEYNSRKILNDLNETFKTALSNLLTD